MRKWQTLSLPQAGVIIQIPEDAYNLQLHHKSTGIGDSVWFITIDVERKNAIEFEEPDLPSPGDNGYDDDDYMAWLTWRVAFHPEVSEYSDGMTRQFRRDVRLSLTEVASVHVTYRPAPFTPMQREADVKAIKRIIESVKPMPRSIEATANSRAGKSSNE